MNASEDVGFVHFLITYSYFCVSNLVLRHTDVIVISYRYVAPPWKMSNYEELP